MVRKRVMLDDLDHVFQTWAKPGYVC